MKLWVKMFGRTYLTKLGFIVWCVVFGVAVGGMAVWLMPLIAKERL